MADHRFILWDNDGVLVDTEHGYFRANQRALSELGIEMSQGDYLRFMVAGRSCWELAGGQAIDADTLAAKRLVRDGYYEEFLATAPIDIPGVRETLEQLSTHYRMAVVTTSRRAHFDLIHRRRDLLARMEFVLAREDYEHSKPHPEPYLSALQRFGASPEEVVVIEDSQRGLRSAIAAGLDCAIVRNRFTANHDFTGAKYLLDAITELPALLADNAANS